MIFFNKDSKSVCNNFGVTLDGHIYAEGGKIAGWDFEPTRLYNTNSNTVI